MGANISLQCEKDRVHGRRAVSGRVSFVDTSSGAAGPLLLAEIGIVRVTVARDILRGRRNVRNFPSLE